jgi:tetratricopeptide (TPR) repeat protein
MRWRLLSAGLLLVFVSEWASTVPRLSQTFDEADHLFAGFRYWTCGDFGINPEHPPLAKLVAAAPLVLMGVREEGTPCAETLTTTAEDYAQAREFLFSHDPDRLLNAARLSEGVFALLAALLVLAWASRLGGPKAGTLALALFVFEPTVVAHSALVTTDMAVTAFLLAACWAWERAPDSAPHVVLAGVFSGLCLASKHSGALVFPLLVLLSVPLFKGRWGRGAASLLAAMLVGWITLWGSYGFRFAARRGPLAMTSSLPQYIERSTRRSGVAPLVLVETLERLRVLPQAYLYGTANVLIGSGAGGHTYLFGTLYPRGVWFYFPSALLVKWTLGFMALLAVALVGLGRAPPRARLLLVPALAYLLVTMTSRMNIGVRHALPIFPFLCVLVGVQAAVLLEGRALLLGAFLALHAASSLRGFPDYLAYSNELFGGAKSTYRVLSDSNADWGQGLKEARAYLESRGVRDCALAYFGTADPVRYGVPCRALPGSPPRPTPVIDRLVEGPLLVSAGLWAGIPSGPGLLNPMEPLRGVPPTAVIGGSLLVFEGRFDLPLLAAQTRDARSRVLLDEGRTQAALDEAEEAVRLAPQDPFVRRTLARVLLKAGDPDRAQKALEEARRLAETMSPLFHQRLLRSLEGEF